MVAQHGRGRPRRHASVGQADDPAPGGCREQGTSGLGPGEHGPGLKIEYTVGKGARLLFYRAEPGSSDTSAPR